MKIKQQELNTETDTYMNIYQSMCCNHSPHAYNNCIHMRYKTTRRVGGTCGVWFGLDSEGHVRLRRSAA